MSRNGVQPEALNDAELRVYELAKQTMPLAEIAVRLGVPIGEAERRIEHVCARLGVADRAGLREREGAQKVAQEGERAEGEEHRSAGTQEGGSEPALRRRAISRRAVLIGGGVAAGLAAGGAVAGLLLRGDENAPASAAGTPTPLPTPPATATPSDAFAKIEPAPDAWLHKTFAPGELIDWDHGVFFMDVESGNVEAWRVSELASREPAYGLGFGYQASGDIVYTAGNVDSFVLHRGTGASWKWPSEDLRLVMTLGEDLLFEEFDYPSGLLRGQESGRYRVLAMADLEEKTRFSLPAPWNVPQPKYRGASQRLAIWSGGREGVDPPVLHLLDAGTWKELAAMPLPPAVERWVPYPAGMTVLPGRGLLVQRISYREPSGQPNPETSKPPDLAYMLPLSGDWDQAKDNPVGTEPATTWSANTPMKVVERYARFVGNGGGEGGGERWPVLVVEDDNGEERLKLLSASLLYSDVDFVRWLADGSGFTAMVDSGATEGNGWERLAFAVISASDGKVTRFELPPGAGKEWFQSVYNRGPVPHPTNPDLFSFGRLELHNRKTGKWFRANVSGQEGPGHIDPWSGRDNEMVFSRPHGGHGGWGLPALIAPKVVQQAPKEPLTLRVARAGDCLNLREEPSTSAKVLDCLPDGTVLTLLDLPAGENGIRPPSMARNDEGAWVYVQVSGVKDGKKGWVSSAYVGWA